MAVYRGERELLLCTADLASGEEMRMKKSRKLVTVLLVAMVMTLDACCVVCFKIKRRSSDTRTKGASQTSP